jgi:YD repeat-containing protein
VANPGFKIVGATNRLIAPTDVNGNENGSSPNDKLHYDQAGNLVKDSHTQSAPGARTYDAENRMLTADGPNGLGNAYTYDADGKRTRRSINNGAEGWWQTPGVEGRNCFFCHSVLQYLHIEKIRRQTAAPQVLTAIIFSTQPFVAERKSHAKLL